MYRTEELLKRQRHPAASQPDTWPSFEVWATVQASYPSVTIHVNVFFIKACSQKNAMKHVIYYFSHHQRLITLCVCESGGVLPLPEVCPASEQEMNTICPRCHITNCSPSKLHVSLKQPKSQRSHLRTRSHLPLRCL